MLKTLSVTLFAFTLTLLIVQNLSAQPAGKVVENNIVQSTVLNGPVQYAVYLPPDYTISERYYPVVYFLHGHGDDHTAWRAIRFCGSNTIF